MNLQYGLPVGTGYPIVFYIVTGKQLDITIIHVIIIHYYRVSVCIHYTESIIQSIKKRFEKDNSIGFSLHLHPALFLKIKKQEYTECIANIYYFCKHKNLLTESES